MLSATTQLKPLLLEMMLHDPAAHDLHPAAAVKGNGGSSLSFVSKVKSKDGLVNGCVVHLPAMLAVLFCGWWGWAIC